MPADDLRPALLVGDVQNNIVAMSGAENTPLLGKIAGAIDGARAAGIPVIYVTVGFRPGYPEISPRSKVFGGLPQYGGFLVGDETAVHPAVAPRPDDVQVKKVRYSAFAGSDLGAILRARGINALVITGISTSGIVLSTVRAASDLDYGLTVLSDGVFDPDEEVQRVLLEKVFPVQADVVTVDKWLAAIGS